MSKPTILPGRTRQARAFAVPDTPPPKVFICSPYRGDGDADVEENVENALQYCRMAVERGYSPYCPHVYFTRFMDDDDPAERKLAMYLGKAWLAECDEVWVIGDYVSEGMTQEVATAKRLQIHIRRFGANFEEGISC